MNEEKQQWVRPIPIDEARLDALSGGRRKTRDEKGKDLAGKIFGGKVKQKK